MSNLKIYVDDDTGEPTRATWELESIKLEFNINVDDGETVANMDGCITKELDDGYDSIKGFADVELIAQGVDTVANSTVIDRVEAFGMVQE
jgi:hypothetical protein